jgi:hypothetical protein
VVRIVSSSGVAPACETIPASAVSRFNAG